MPTSIDISGWWLSTWDGASNNTYDTGKLPVGSFIPGFGYFLMAMSEYDGWGADWVISPSGWKMGNNHDNFGDALFLYDLNDEVIDKVCWDDANIVGQNESAYEGWPFIEEVPGDMGGSIERLPGFNDPFSGNWQDTDNNSVDFVFRKFVDAQGTSSIPEYPPWTADITSPFLLPDNHPANQVSTQPAQIKMTMEEPVQQDFFGEEIVDVEPQEASSTIGITVSLVLIVSIVLLLVPRRVED